MRHIDDNQSLCGERTDACARELPELVDPFRDESGWTTAELLGNAALAIAALVLLWVALRTVGESVISWIQGQLLGG